MRWPAAAWGVATLGLLGCGGRELSASRPSDPSAPVSPDAAGTVATTDAGGAVATPDAGDASMTADAGPPSPPPPPSPWWTTVAVTINHLCRIRSGALYCLGMNDEGELGIGDAAASTVQFTRVWTADDWNSVAASAATATRSTCALRRGELHCWGGNGAGELGLGDTTPRNSPTRVGTRNDWRSIAMGAGAACGVAGGELYCWGEVLGEIPGGQVPARLGTWNDWDMVRVGSSMRQEFNFACGLRGGALYCWGANNHGQLGTGDTTSKASPTQVGADTDWTTVAVGSEHVCGLRNGRLYCWGANREGQLGVPIQVPIGTTDDRPTVQQIGTDANWSVISVGDSHSCGLRDGAAYCWGAALGGVLGIPSSGTFGVPETRVGSDNTWVSLSLTEDHSCGERNGDLYCWGSTLWDFGNTGPIDSPTLMPTPPG